MTRVCQTRWRPLQPLCPQCEALSSGTTARTGHSSFPFLNPSYIPDLGEVVHPGVLEDGRDDEEIAHDDEPVECGWVGHTGQLPTRVECQRRQRQEGCDA